MVNFKAEPVPPQKVGELFTIHLKLTNNTSSQFDLVFPTPPSLPVSSSDSPMEQESDPILLVETAGDLKM